MSNEFFMAMVPPTVTHQEKQVRVAASEIVEKFWAEVPGIYVRIDRLP